MLTNAQLIREKISYTGRFFHAVLRGAKAFLFAGNGQRDNLPQNRYQCYYEWWRQKVFESDFGVSSIRILTVTPNRKRMENLIKGCFQVKAGRTGSALFWFTTMKNVDVFRPHELLGRIWRKALSNDSHLYSLID